MLIVLVSLYISGCNRQADQPFALPVVGSPTALPGATSTSTASTQRVTPSPHGVMLSNQIMPVTYQTLVQKPPDGGSPVYVAGTGTIRVQVHTERVKRVDIMLTLSARDTISTVSAIPDAQGNVVVSIQLPQQGRTYVVQGVGVLTGQRSPAPGDTVNERNERIVVLGGFRVTIGPDIPRFK